MGIDPVEITPDPDPFPDPNIPEEEEEEEKEEDDERNNGGGGTNTDNTCSQCGKVQCECEKRKAQILRRSWIYLSRVLWQKNYCRRSRWTR